MSAWVPVIDYDGRTDPGTLRIVDTPWRWALLVAFTCWLCGRHRGLGRLGNIIPGGLAYRLFAWSARREEAASVDVFRVPLTPEVSAQIKQAIENHEETP